VSSLVQCGQRVATIETSSVHAGQEVVSAFSPITRMTDYLTANGEKVDAIIGLGDLVTGSIQRVFDQNGIEPGSIMVVGWGNSLDTTQAVMDGYVNAAMWQDPQAQSYVALSLASMISSGVPVGFNVITGALYEADTAAIYHGIMGGN
jgi:simple sugar transport system substrate-binding protein